MTSIVNRNPANQSMKALFSVLFPVPAASTTRRGKGHAVSMPAKARSAAAARDKTKARSRLQQEIFRVLVVIALASGMAGLLAAYNLRDSIQAQAQQWVMVIKG